MIARWVEERIEHVYARRRETYLETFWYAVLGFLLFTVMLALPLYLRYVDATPAQAARVVLFHLVLVPVVGRLVVIPGWRKLSEPVLRWLRGERDPALTAEAWQCSRQLAVRMALVSFVRGTFGMLLPSLTYVSIEFQLSPGDILLAGYAGLSSGLWASAFGAPASDLWFRPVTRELSRAIGSPTLDLHRPGGVTMGRKLLVAVPLISILTGVTVAIAATAASGDVWGLASLILLAFVVTFSTSGLMVLLLTRSVVAPMEDLLTATRRVRDGDLSARAEVTTDDELGAVSLRVNAMLDHLEQMTTANVQLLDEVRASRLRIISASDEERRRVERNIHDGAQQLLVSLALRFRMLQDAADLSGTVRTEVDECAHELNETLDELRELARGLHPPVLTTDGLRAALEQLAERATVPVTVTAPDERFHDTIESTAYFVASEALTNITKHADASAVAIELSRRNGQVVLEISDDGVGAAQPVAGSGLSLLMDRVEAVGGRLDVLSPHGGGTRVRVRIPARRDGDLS